MTAIDFANNITKGLINSIGQDPNKYDENTPNTANIALTSAIIDYLEANTVVNVTYIGSLPTVPPTPDPLVSDTFNITGTKFIVVGNTFSSWVSSLESGILNSFFLKEGIIGLLPSSPTLIFKPLVELSAILTQEKIKESQLNNQDNPFPNVWNTICQCIIDWLVNSSPITFPAQNKLTGSIGSATLQTIIII